MVELIFSFEGNFKDVDGQSEGASPKDSMVGKKPI